MPRRNRVEVAGGLYHVITRGNNRQSIFHCPDDYEKFLSLLATQKAKLPFFLYAYCLMTNHVHLLIERQADAVGRIMQRLLTAYSHYYNCRYRHVGHVLQGRYKAILCQSDRYLAELVRYIHLNPVRARMLDKPEDYKYSGHRAYLGLEPAGILDIDPVLRHFGAKKESARKAYRQFVDAGLRLGHQEHFYLTENGCVLGDEEFVDEAIHRIGETTRLAEGSDRPHEATEFNPTVLIEVIERTYGLSGVELCGPSKSRRAVEAKEMFVAIGSEMGANAKLLSQFTGISLSTVSRRKDSAWLKMRDGAEISALAARVRKQYRRDLKRIAKIASLTPV